MSFWGKVLAFLGLLALLWIQVPHKAYDFKNVAGQLWAWEDKPGTWAVVAYVQPEDWNALEPWIIYWSRRPGVKFIGIVDYTGAQRDFFKNKIAELNCPGVELLIKFDSSPFAVMPMTHAPAAYRIDRDKKAQGPFYRYYEVLDRVL